jgi:hypothetical protein
LPSEQLLLIDNKIGNVNPKWIPVK